MIAKSKNCHYCKVKGVKHEAQGPESAQQGLQFGPLYSFRIMKEGITLFLDIYRIVSLVRSTQDPSVLQMVHNIKYIKDLYSESL